MELKIKNYKHQDENILFECSYGGKTFNAWANPAEKIFKQDEYEATEREKERIGVILMNKADRLMRSH